MAIIFILALGVFFRFFNLTGVPPGLYPDEAMNGNNALEALHTGMWKVFYPENNGREGLFINIQALSIKTFGNTPWALRDVSALMGSLTILAVFFLTRELFKNQGLHSKFLILNSEIIALLAAFFIATSYWHINFSRIGFRAIMLPLISALGMYFLLKGLRTGKLRDLILAGIFVGLGFHTYIAFRFFPFVIAVPLVLALWQWWRTKNQESRIKNYGIENKNLNSLFLIHTSKSCAPCLILLFLFITLITALPIGLYFLHHPADFFSRTGQVSVFTAASPIQEFVKSNVLTAGMFFVRGDCNWRHNFPCRPELHPFVGLFFLVGVIFLIKDLLKQNYTLNLVPYTLLTWLLFMSLPATLTREGLPHALRAIGMVPPVMALSGFGAWSTGTVILHWFSRQKNKWPQRAAQITRIEKELMILFLLVLLTIPFITYRVYFREWAGNVNTYGAFATDLLSLGQHLASRPTTTEKYIIVNLPGTAVHGIPMPAQTVMFATDTFAIARREETHTHYLAPQEIDTIEVVKNKQILIAFLNSRDTDLVKSVRKKFPELKVTAPGDFLTFETQ